MFNYIKLLQCRSNYRKIYPIIVKQNLLVRNFYQQKSNLLSKFNHRQNLIAKRFKSSETNAKNVAEANQTKNQTVKLRKSDLQRLFSLATKEKWKIAGKIFNLQLQNKH